MSAVATELRAGSSIGRFRLIDLLGRGAQATVWRAHDPRLDREVAIKLLDPAADTLAVSQWLHEARAVSRLAHPHIVPLFEADEQQGQPYLVFELVRGKTLSETLRQRGAMRPRDAVQAMLGVLDALRLAHAQGIVHRDLKPSNILIDADGRARVMDFGIAARVADGADGRVVGTPGYMSPEAARGLAATPAMDVFSSGMVLAELLAGHALLRERDPFHALHRVINEDLRMPAGACNDDALAALVHRALARDVAQRFPDVVALRDALQAWLEPEADSPDAGDGHGTLEFLLRRMRSKTDFPALSDSVLRIQRIASSDSGSLASLADEILKDVALTHKLLRVVNSAHFQSAGGGTISTVSRAVAVVGFAGIRNMALSLVLLEHMTDKTQARRLKAQFLRSLVAGQMASELVPLARDSEDAFLGTLLRNLGALLAEFYFPEEAQAIREQLATPGARPEAVAERVLGIGFDQLGIGIAKSWGLPESLQRCMLRIEGDVPTRALTRGPDWLRWLAAASHDAADAILDQGGGGSITPKRLQGVAQRYGRALGIEAGAWSAAAERARAKIALLAPALGLPMNGARAAPPSEATDAATPAQTMVLPSATPAPAAGPEAAVQLLSAGIQDITDTLADEGFKLNDVLRMILETMLRALAFQRVVFCLRDAKTETLRGRFGLGADAMALSPGFSVPLRLAPGVAPDLFSAVCMKGIDTLIADSSAAHVARRLPDWYRQGANGGAFLLLPMQSKGATFGLIYGDMAQHGGLKLAERELALLRTLRNQALMAFRQSS